MRTYSKRVEKHAPCLDCTDREPGCHGKCETYKEWLKPILKARDARKKDVDAEEMRLDAFYKAIKRRYEKNGHY